MNGLILFVAVICSTLLFTHAQDIDDNMEMDKRYRSFAFAKRFDALGHNLAFAKRSGDDAADDDQLSEPEKRARFAFAKRAARFAAFAKRARFAFA